MTQTAPQTDPQTAPQTAPGNGTGPQASTDDDGVPLGVALARIAAEQARLAALATEIEALLAADPGLPRRLDGPARQGLQRLDYLRQALDCLARTLHALPPRGPVALAALTRDLPLADLARRLAPLHDPARADPVHPAPAAPPRSGTAPGAGEVDFFG